MPSPPITLADRYVLESEIARGGMGSVWRAKDEVLARPVAVKLLHEHHSTDQAFLDRFRREALAAARLAHPNIVSIYDTGSEVVGGQGVERHFIVMEYCGRGTLRELAGKGPMGPERIAAIGRAVCDALGYAHRHEVIHRDVKPANVLITEDGTLKVGDFGIAKAAFVKGDLTTTGAILGTVTYISPEQARGEEPDARSDIYALGVVLYELATGRAPFKGESQIATAMAHVREAPPQPRSIRAGIPRSLEAVILKALAKDPDERFQSAEEMASTLDAAHGGETTVLPRTAGPRPGVVSSAETAEEPPSGTDLRWVIPVLLIAAAVVALALIVPRLVDTSDPSDGGTSAGSNGQNGAAESGIEVNGVDDFDPHGGGEEHSEEADLAADGDADTSWSTESYNDPLEVLKPGVGLVFDLGDEVEVERVEVSGNAGSFELRSSSEVGEDESAFDVVGDGEGLTGKAVIRLDDAATARYWLVWITSLPGASGSASISEVSFFGP